MAFISGSVRKFPKFRIALDEFGQEFVLKLARNLITLDKVATRKLIKSLDYKITEPKPDEYRLTLLAQNYFYWVDKGRKPGAPPPLKPLEDWARAKRLQFRSKKGRFLSYRQTAFIVQRSLTAKPKGAGKIIKPTNVLKNTIADMLKEKKMLLQAGFKGDLETLINETFQDIKNNQ